MKYRIALGGAIAATLLVGGVMAAGTLKSGPQVGSSKILPFDPLHVTGDGAGERSCLV